MKREKVSFFGKSPPSSSDGRKRDDKDGRIPTGVSATGETEGRLLLCDRWKQVQQMWDNR